MLVFLWWLEVAVLINQLTWVIRRDVHAVRHRPWLQLMLQCTPAFLTLNYVLINWLRFLGNCQNHNFRPFFRNSMELSLHLTLISEYMLLAFSYVFRGPFPLTVSSALSLSLSLSPAVIPSGSAPFFFIFRVRFFISDPNSLQHEQTRYISLFMCKWDRNR